MTLLITLDNQNSRQISDPHIGDFACLISGEEVSNHFLQALSLLKRRAGDLLLFPAI